MDHGMAFAMDQGSLVVHGQSRRVGPGRNGPRVDGSMWPAASHGRIHEPERGKVGEGKDFRATLKVQIMCLF